MGQNRFSSIGEQVYQQLSRDVRHGNILPGQRITIRDLADAYQVSTMPIREALQKLSSEGLVIYERRGWKVNSLSAQDVLQIYEIRKELEALALKWASGNITTKDISSLKQLALEMDECIRDDVRWLEINFEFHMDMYRLSGSERLLSIIKSLWSSIDPYLRIYTLNAGPLDESQRQHHEIIDALKSRDLDRLDELIRMHLQITAGVILKAMEETSILERGN